MDTGKLLDGGLDRQITVRDMIHLLGGHIQHYPVIGDTVTLQGKRHVERDIRDTDNIYISYEWAGDSVDNQTLCRIYIGHRFSGPMLSLCNTGAVYPLDTNDDRGPICGEWVWHNLYGNGNHGKNYACGGTWSSASRREYATATLALQDRDYMVGNIPSNQRYTESALLLAEVQDFVNNFEE